jgi:tetratricopeptide (TPR) repeat protein
MAPGYPPPAGYIPSYDQSMVPSPALPAVAPSSLPMGAPASLPMGAAQPAANYPAPSMTSNSTGGLLATSRQRLLVFSGMTLVSIIGLALILSRTVFAHPLVVTSEAEEVYRQGLRLFAAGDYDLAKTKFLDVVAQTQDAPEPRRYARLCDAETQARGSLKNAERALVNHRYAEAVRALDGVESTSVYYDQASQQRKDTAPKASAEMVDEARRIAQENPDDARSKLKSALELDPNNNDARDLLAKLHGGAPSSPGKGPAVRPSTANPPPSGTTLAAVGGEAPHEPGHHVRHAVKEDDEESLTAVKAPKGGGVAAPDSKAANAAYKSRDFNSAFKLFMADSMKISNEKQAVKVIEYANQVRSLAQLVDKASGDESKNAAQAVKEYEQAIQLDQKLGHGMHASYFKGRIGDVAVQGAKQSFAQGKFEDAYATAVAAQRSGADASSVLHQLEQKASDLVSQGVSVQKSNLPQAKQYWRTVLKIVPTSSSSYTKAYSLLNSASAPKRDEDEE